MPKKIIVSNVDMLHHRIKDVRKYVLLLIVGVLLITAPIWVADLLNQHSLSRLTVAQATNQLTPQAADAMIQMNHGNPNFIILDVRTPEEYSAGHLEKAINLNYYHATFRHELERLNRTKIYLIYCRSGIRSGRGWILMQEMGFQQAYNLVGGVEAWHQQGFRTVR